MPVKNNSRRRRSFSSRLNSAWRLMLIAPIVFGVSIAAAYIGAAANPEMMRSISRTVEDILRNPQVDANKSRSGSAEVVAAHLTIQDPIPVLATDKTGYLAGETVNISGFGYAAGESVTIQVKHADGSAESNAGHEAFAVAAASDGSISATWNLTSNDSVGNDFVVTSSGSSSGVGGAVELNRIATVRTDKLDYQPGETAVISGTGFNANEVVTLLIQHSNGNNFGNGHEPFEATADADGRLTANWYVDPDDSESSIFRLTATGRASGLTATYTFTDIIVSFIDVDGPDDEPGQKDLNAMSSDLGATAIGITWNWDDTDFGNLGGNTGDACALIDTNQDGLANFSFCVTADGNPANKIANRLYTCNNTRSDRCAGPTPVATFTSTSTASVDEDSDPFAAHPAHSAGNDCDNDANCLTDDTVANVTLKFSDVGGSANAKLLNVCSYPSEVPNSDPSDCVVAPDSGFLTIKKTTETNEGTTTEFTFNSSVPSSAGDSSFSAQITGAQANVLVANQVPFSPTTLNLSEVVPAGWDLTAASCAIQTAIPTPTGTFSGNTITGLSIQNGLETICTFTDGAFNVTRGKIIVKKETDPDGDPQSFSFTASYDADGFSLTDGQQNDSGFLTPGSYSVSETVPSGWDLDSATCSDGSDPSSISLAAGETVTCTFTNEKDANIVVVKQTDPDGDPQSFSFTASYDGDGFSLSDGQQNDSGDIDPGTYSVSENTPAGWDLESATCSDGSAPGSISLQAGETVTCTFTNEKDANIVVVKQTDPDGDPQSFTFTASYDGDGFSLSDGQQNNSGDLEPGTYSVSETTPAGWDLESATCSDGSDPSSINLAAGETVTCTFTNEKDASIVVIKQTLPDGDPAVFAFTASYDGDGFSLSDGQQNNSGDLDPGTYSVSETVPAGWDLTSSPCVSSKGYAENSGNISLQAGETVTCTFNNRKRARLIVEKQTNPDGATGSFTFTGTAAGTISDGGNIPVGNLVPGEYTSTENDPAPNFDLTSIVCNDSNSTGHVPSRTATFRLEPGETVKCTFTNTQRGKVEVLKLTNGGVHPELDIRFTLYRDGPDADPDLTVPGDVELETLSTSGDADGLLQFTTKLVPGTKYTVCENPVPAGWTSLWMITFNEGGNIVTPYNPNANDAIPQDLGIRCIDFTVTAGQTKTFEVHNDFPGGDPRTIGYWKNWNGCSGGGQAANAAKNGGPAAGFFILENLLPQLIGDFNVDTCAKGVKILSKQDQAGKSKANDGAYELAAQLLAAKLNLAAGAETCNAVQQAVIDGQALLDYLNFNGSGTYLDSKVKGVLATKRTQALSLANTLDKYNNGNLCP